MSMDSNPQGIRALMSRQGVEVHFVRLGLLAILVLVLIVGGGLGTLAWLVNSQRHLLEDDLPILESTYRLTGDTHRLSLLAPVAAQSGSADELDALMLRAQGLSEAIESESKHLEPQSAEPLREIAADLRDGLGALAAVRKAEIAAQERFAQLNRNLASICLAEGTPAADGCSEALRIIATPPDQRAIAFPSREALKVAALPAMIKELVRGSAGDEGMLILRTRLIDLADRRNELLQQQEGLAALLAGQIAVVVEEATQRMRAERQRTVLLGEYLQWGMVLVSIATLGALMLALHTLRHKVIFRVIALRDAVVGWQRGTPHKVPAGGDDELAELAQALDSLISTIEQKTADLETLAATDMLTGLDNRRSFLAHCVDIQRELARYGGDAALLMADLDHFKRINDLYGHAAGDAVLRRVADVFRATLRETDYCCRFGGEEFAVLMPNTDLAAALGVAERVRAKVAMLELTAESGDVVHVTVSIGAAQIAQSDAGVEDIDAALCRADRALYAAKAAGRNAVVPAA